MRISLSQGSHLLVTWHSLPCFFFFTSWSYKYTIYSCFEWYFSHHSPSPDGAYPAEEHQTAFAETGHHRHSHMLIPPTLSQLWGRSPSPWFCTQSASSSIYSNSLPLTSQSFSFRYNCKTHPGLADRGSHHKSKHGEGCKQGWTSFILVSRWNY